MFKNNLKRNLVVIITFILSAIIFINAEKKGLIFSEVHLNKKNSNNIWLEVTNIRNEEITLSGLRFFHIRRKNILPRKIQKKGGIKIDPKESIILCSNKKIFNKRNKADTEVYEIKLLSGITEGGFFILRGKNTKGKYTDAFRYGKGKHSKQYKEQLGDYVVPFSKNKSYKRKITGNKNRLNKSSKGPQSLKSPYLHQESIKYQKRKRESNYVYKIKYKNVGNYFFYLYNIKYSSNRF